jgi:hypothetical protein
MKNQRSLRKLALEKTTLRKLGQIDLNQIAGGIITFVCGATEGQRCLLTDQDPCHG